MSDSPIYYLVYASAARKPFSKTDLIELLTQAREKNRRLGITGLLLYRDGDFIQLLEGPKDAVKALYDAIDRDPRHVGSMVMAEGEREERLFADWSMGFRDLADQEVQATPGYSPFMNSPRIAQRLAPQPDECLQLLALFRPRY